MKPGIHKLRYLLATRSALLLRVSVIVGLIGLLGAGVTFANPPTTEVAASADQQPITMSLHTRATVVEASSLYSRGEVLTDMPVYMRPHTPTVTLGLATTPPSGQRTQIDQRISLVYEARTSSDELFWQQRDVLERTKTSTTGETVVSNASLNISATEQRLTQLESEVGDAGRISAYVVVESQYATHNATGSMKSREEIRIRPGSYEIAPMTEKRTVGTTETTVQIDESKATRFTLPIIGTLHIPHTTLVTALLGLCGFLGVGVTVAYAERFDPEEERGALHKARYAEWISEGTLPANFETQSTQLSTLEGLVDIAIDSNKRIVYDPSQGKYAVIDAEMVYLYGENSDQDFLWT